MKDYLLANPEACDAIEKEIRENAHKLLTPQAKRAAMVSGRTPTAVDITAAAHYRDKADLPRAAHRHAGG